MREGQLLPSKYLPEAGKERERERGTVRTKISIIIQSKTRYKEPLQRSMVNTVAMDAITKSS